MGHSGKVIALIPAFHKLRDLGSSLIPGDKASSARERLVAYLVRYPRRVIDGDELMVVSGIAEWARRIRELRVQFGWSIYSGVTFNDMAEDARTAENAEEPESITGVMELADYSVNKIRIRNLCPSWLVMISPSAM